MWDKIKNIVRKWLGINLPEEPQPVERFARDYEDIRGDTITATIANKLATLTFADSTMEISDSSGAETLSARAQLVADKLTQIAVLLCLMPMKYWWVVGILIFKEITIGILTLVALHRTHNVYSAGWYGKLCTVVIYLSMGILILWEVVIGSPVPSLFILIDAIVISALVLLSFVKYFLYFTRILRDAREKEPREKS